MQIGLLIVSLLHRENMTKKKPRQEKILSGKTWGKSENVGEFLSEKSEELETFYFQNSFKAGSNLYHFFIRLTGRIVHRVVRPFLKGLGIVGS